MEVTAKNWDGEDISIEVLCESHDIRKIAAAAHREIAKMRDGRGRPYTTYQLVRINGQQPPFDVACK